MTVLNRLAARISRRRAADDGGPSGRRNPVVFATAAVVAVALVVAAVLVFSRDPEGAGPSSTSVPSKGATLDTTTTTVPGATTTTTTPIENYTGVADPDAPPDVNLDATLNTLPDPPGEPFIADPLPGVASLAVTTVAPSSGNVGATVRLAGTGLDRVTSVTFNGVPVESFTALSSTEIVTAVPEGATTGPIRLATDGGESINAPAFAVSSPSITGLASQLEAAQPTGAASFSGSSAALINAGSSPDLAIGTNDFTIEWFQYQTPSASRYPRAFTWGTYPYAELSLSTDDGVIRVWVDGGLRMSYSPPNMNFLYRWMHYALVRKAGLMSLYLDGIRVASTVNTTDLQPAGYPLLIGSEDRYSEFGGYMSNFHLVNGTALYSGDAFTVPTLPLSPVANTKLLLRFASQAEFLVDSSPTRKTVTARTGVTFGLPSAIGSAPSFGTARFDGEQESYLKAAPSTDWNIGKGDFTVEWFQYQYPNVGSRCCPRVFSFGKWPYADLAFSVDAGVMRVYVEGSGVMSYTPPTAEYLYNWIHIAVTRSAGVLNFYINGERKWSVANTSDIQTTQPLTIGSEPDGTTTISEFPGYLSNFHFVNGTSLYTGPSFTVPTGPIAPVANSKLLLRFASGADFLADSSPSARTVTAGRVTSHVVAGVGSVVTISGANLQGATAVSFGGVDTTPLSVSATSVTARVPAGAVPGPVTVRTADSSAISRNSLTITTPVIQSLSTYEAAPGEVVTITGNNLTRTTAVMFGGVGASFQVISDTRVNATVPSSGLSGNVAVITAMGIAASEATFVLPPRLTSFDLWRQEPGKSVILSGVNLAETTSVTFASSEQLAPFTVLSPTQLSITVPDDAVTGAVKVTNPAGTAVTGTFTVLPAVYELVPSSGPPGTVVYVRGTGLNSSNTTVVKYGPVTSVAFTILSSRELTFTVPATATTSATVFVGSLPGLSFTLAAAPAVVLPGTSVAGGVTAPTASGGSTSTAAALVGASSIPLGGGLSIALTASSLVSGQLQGTGTASLGSFQFPAAITYTSPGNWALTAISGSSVGKMRINSTDVSVSSWSGSITASGGTTSWSLSGKALSSSTLVPSKVVIAGADVRVVPTCPDFATSAMCASAPTAYVRVEAATTFVDTVVAGSVLTWTSNALGLEVNLGNGMPSMSPSNRTLVPFRSVLNPVSGAFVLNATFDKDVAAQLGGTRSTLMRSMRLTMANGDASAKLNGSTAVKATGTLGGFDVLVSGRGQIGLPGIGSWNVTNVASVFTDNGVAVTGDIPSGGNVAELAVASFGYVRMSTTVTIDGTVVQVPANTFVFTGSIKSPTFLSRLGVSGAMLNAFAVYTENSGVVKIYASVPIGVTLPSIPGLRTSIDSMTVGLEIPIDPALANLVALVSGQGTITPSGRGPIAVTIEGRYDFTDAELSLSLSATSPNGGAIWADVFGVTGFDMNSVAIQVGINKSFPYLSAGLMGTGTVPQVLRSYMGMENRTVPTSFTANLSINNPCLEVGIGVPGSTDSIIAVPPGLNVLTAGYASIKASTNGCRVGTIAASSEVAPGIEIAAMGSLLGNPVRYFASFDPTPVGPSKTPTYLAWTDVSMKSLPGIALDATYRYSVAIGGWTPFPKTQVRGGIALGSNARIALSGSCEIRITGPRCDQSGSGSISIAGFRLNMELSIQGWATPNVVYSGSASIRVGGVRLTLAGTFGTAGVLQPGTMDNPGLVYAFSASGRFPGSIVDTFSVSINKTPGTTVLPSGTMSVSGNIGGLFAQSSGSTRWGGSTTFTPSMANVTIPAYFTIPIGVANVPVKLKMKLCLTGSCAGTVTPSMDVNFTFLRQPISLSDIPVDPNNWDFAYRLQKSISKSGQAGSSWGGIKGTVTSAIDFSISSASISLNSTSASAKAYIGAFGSWNYVGTVGASFNVSTGEYCFSASGKRLCL